MSTIATGFLQIETFQENQLDTLKNVMIRIYKIEQQELVFEDFFMTNTNGLSPQIALYAPSIELLKENDQVVAYEQYQLELRCKGYQTQFIKGIQIVANIYSNMSVYMKKNDGQQHDIDQHIQISKQPLDEPQQKLVLIENLKKKGRLPKSIIVHVETADEWDVENRSMFLQDYIKHCACYEFCPAWPQEVLKANIILLMTKIINDNHLLEHKDIQAITNDVFRYEPQRNLYSTITNLVDEVYGIVLYQTTLDIYSQMWNPTALLSLTKPYANAYTILKSYINTPIALKKVDESNESMHVYQQPLSIGNRYDELYLVKLWLYEIANKYLNVSISLNNQDVYDDETKAIVMLFQQHYHLAQNGIIDKKTWYKLQDIYEKVKKNRYPNHKIQVHKRDEITLLQQQLNYIATYYIKLPSCAITGTITHGTKLAIISFQQMLGISDDGIIDIETIRLVDQVYRELLEKK